MKINPNIEKFFLEVYGKFSSDSNDKVIFIDDWKIPLGGIPVACNTDYCCNDLYYPIDEKLRKEPIIYFLHAPEPNNIENLKVFSEKQMLRIIKLKAFI